MRSVSTEGISQLVDLNLKAPMMVIRLVLPMPRIRGYLATVGHLFPTLGRALRPMLEKKGRRVEERLKRERGQT